MSFVTQFTQYLSEKEKTKEHSTLYNYLRCFYPNEQTLTTNIFTRFYKKALLFPYWQSHLTSLQKTLKVELTSFAKLYNPIGFDPEELVSAEQWQLITIQRERDLIAIVDSYLQSQLSPQDQVKVLPLQTERVLALVLKFDGNLDVFSFGPLTIINNGKIEPITSLSELHYSPYYELRSTHQQTIEYTNLNFISFRIREKKITGYQCQNSWFQQSNEFKHKNIHEIDSLFCTLKKIESFFIQSKSDPHYKSLIKLLHEHYRRILTSPFSHSLETQEVLSQAKKALKNLYPQDRLLFLLTANIDFHLRKQQQRKPILNSPQ